jgi:hypothetical protein
LKTSGRKDKSAAFLFQLQALERDEPQNIVLDLWSCHSEVHRQSETPVYKLDFTDTISQVIILIGIFSHYLRAEAGKLQVQVQYELQ